MTNKEFLKIIEELNAARQKDLEVKGKEYTRTCDDRLENFKTAAKDLSITPMQAWGVYARKHWDSILHATKGEGFLSEPAIERFGDLINYLELGYALYKEQEASPQEDLFRDFAI